MMALGNRPAFPSRVFELRVYSKINSNAGILGKKSRLDLFQPYLLLFILGYVTSERNLRYN